jgi:hypothetical protein
MKSPYDAHLRHCIGIHIAIECLHSGQSRHHQWEYRQTIVPVFPSQVQEMGMVVSEPRYKVINNMSSLIGLIEIGSP